MEQAKKDYLYTGLASFKERFCQARASTCLLSILGLVVK